MKTERLQPNSRTLQVNAYMQSFAHHPTSPPPPPPHPSPPTPPTSRQHRATKIQSWYRMLAPWRAHRKLRSATLALQCRMRQKVAYGELRDLRIKAKDVGNLKGDNERLKAEILELRQAAKNAAASAGDERVRVSCGMRRGEEGVGDRGSQGECFFFLGLFVGSTGLRTWELRGREGSGLSRLCAIIDFTRVLRS